MGVKMNVSVIITAHNYGKYLPEAIESVLTQTYDDYEIIIVNDGSTDNTEDILKHYEQKADSKITTIKLPGVGLAKAANIGIQNSCGEFVIRLDADDYFDENILLIESNILKRNPNIGMVYPDYYTITKYGEIIDNKRLMKVNKEIKLLDRSPLAAGAMYRRSCFESLGGYNEDLRYQEDYDFWIRFIDKFNVYNVNLPLMYYRKHSASMSNNFEARMKARQFVKEKFVTNKKSRDDKYILGIIPAMGLFRNREKLALKQLCGKPLIAYTIEEALKSEALDRLIVSTEDQEIADIARNRGAEVPFLRPLDLARTNVPIEKVLFHLIHKIKERNETVPDIIVLLPYETPFMKYRHVKEAIDTLLIYDTDSVVGVTEDISFHWRPGKFGLELVGYHQRTLREDKDTIYKENATIYAIKTSNIEKGEYLGKIVGHIEMSQKESWRIEDKFGLWVAEKVMENDLNFQNSDMN